MSETRWLSSDQMRAWLRLIAVVELLPGALETQLHEDSGLTHFEYFTLAMLSEAPDQTLRMTGLSIATNATLPRLSHVVRRLEGRGLVERFPCEDDRRATNARLTEAGLQAVIDAAPGHVENVQRLIFDALSPEQVEQLTGIAGAILGTLDPERKLAAWIDPDTRGQVGSL